MSPSHIKVPNMFKKLFCIHIYEGAGFSYAICRKCGKQIFSPEVAQKKINKFCSSMVDAGHWDEEHIKPHRRE